DLARDVDELLPGRGVDRHAVLLAIGLAGTLGLARRQHFLHAGLRLGRLHPGDEGLDLVLEERRAAHRLWIDDHRQHVVDDVVAVLLDGARTVRAATGQRAGQQVADHRETAALVQAERQDGAERRVVHYARLGGR